MPLREFFCISNSLNSTVESRCAFFTRKKLFFFPILGADDVISIDYDNEATPTEQQILFKELSIRKEYDLIYFTTETDYDKEFIRSFLTPGGLIIDTVEPNLQTDRSILSQFFYSVSVCGQTFLNLCRLGWFQLALFWCLQIYVKLKLISAKLTNTRPTWDGPHLCHLALDRLGEDLK